MPENLGYLRKLWFSQKTKVFCRKPWFSQKTKVFYRQPWSSGVYAGMKLDGDLNIDYRGYPT